MDNENILNEKKIKSVTFFDLEYFRKLEQKYHPDMPFLDAIKLEKEGSTNGKKNG